MARATSSGPTGARPAEGAPPSELLAASPLFDECSAAVCEGSTADGGAEGGPDSTECDGPGGCGAGGAAGGIYRNNDF